VGTDIVHGRPSASIDLEVNRIQVGIRFSTGKIRVCMPIRQHVFPIVNWSALLDTTSDHVIIHDPPRCTESCY